MKRLCAMLLLAMALAFVFPRLALAAVPDGMFEAVEAALGAEQMVDLDDIDQYLKQEDGFSGFSFSALVKLLLEGRGREAGRLILDTLKEGLFGQISRGSRLVGQLLMLGLLGAVFANFSQIFSGGQVAETGFFMTYLMAFALLAAAFSESAELAGAVLSRQVDFMKVLMPVYAASAVWAGAGLASAAWYQVVMLVIGGIQWLYLHLLLPGVRIYLLLVLADHMTKEDMLSKLTEGLRTGIFWGMKSLFGLVFGFQLIQGMVLPYADAVKATGVQKLLQVIPGVGAGAGAVTKMVLGSGVLIKNTVGAAAVVVLVIISLIPIVKLAVLLLCCRGAAAILEPVADKRLVACISSVADGQKMLLGLVTAGLLLFAVTIALICLGTNTAYLA